MLKNNLEKMDFACKETMKKGEDYSKQSQIYLALKNYMKDGNAIGFTRERHARNYIKSLSRDDIKNELLKNIIKKRSCSFYYGYSVRMGTEKKFYDDLSVDECEVLIINAMQNIDMNYIDNLMDENENIINLLIESFCNSRYFNPSFGENNLDDEKILSPIYERLLDKVDKYYSDKEIKNAKRYA